MMYRTLSYRYAQIVMHKQCTMYRLQQIDHSWSLIIQEWLWLTALVNSSGACGISTGFPGMSQPDWQHHGWPSHKGNGQGRANGGVFFRALHCPLVGEWCFKGFGRSLYLIQPGDLLGHDFEQCQVWSRRSLSWKWRRTAQPCWFRTTCINSAVSFLERFHLPLEPLGNYSQSIFGWSEIIANLG